MANPTPAQVEAYIRQRAAAENVDPEFAVRLARRESGFNQYDKDGKQLNTSKRGALGVMQLMPDTAARFKVDPKDWKQNVDGGMKYLRFLLNRYGGNQRSAAAAYNAGEGTVDAWLSGKKTKQNPNGRQTPDGVPNFKETKDYVRIVARQPATQTTAQAQQPTARVRSLVDWLRGKVSTAAPAEAKPTAAPPSTPADTRSMAERLMLGVGNPPPLTLPTVPATPPPARVQVLADRLRGEPSATPPGAPQPELQAAGRKTPPPARAAPGTPSKPPYVPQRPGPQQQQPPQAPQNPLPENVPPRMVPPVIREYGPQRPLPEYEARADVAAPMPVAAVSPRVGAPGAPMPSAPPPGAGPVQPASAPPVAGQRPGVVAGATPAPTPALFPPFFRGPGGELPQNSPFFARPGAPTAPQRLATAPAPTTPTPTAASANKAPLPGPFLPSGAVPQAAAQAGAQYGIRPQTVPVPPPTAAPAPPPAVPPQLAPRPMPIPTPPVSPPATQVASLPGPVAPGRPITLSAPTFNGASPTPQGAPAPQPPTSIALTPPSRPSLSPIATAQAAPAPRTPVMVPTLPTERPRLDLAMGGAIPASIPYNPATPVPQTPAPVPQTPRIAVTPQAFAGGPIAPIAGPPLAGFTRPDLPTPQTAAVSPQQAAPSAAVVPPGAQNVVAPEAYGPPMPPSRPDVTPAPGPTPLPSSASPVLPSPAPTPSISPASAPQPSPKMDTTTPDITPAGPPIGSKQTQLAQALMTPDQYAAALALAQRRGALADALTKMGMQDIPVEQGGKFATRISPFQVAAKLMNAYLGGKMGESSVQDIAKLGAQKRASDLAVITGQLPGYSGAPVPGVNNTATTPNNTAPRQQGTAGPPSPYETPDQMVARAANIAAQITPPGGDLEKTFNAVLERPDFAVAKAYYVKQAQERASQTPLQGALQAYQDALARGDTAEAQLHLNQAMELGKTPPPQAVEVKGAGEGGKDITYFKPPGNAAWQQTAPQSSLTPQQAGQVASTASAVNDVQRAREILMPNGQLDRWTVAKMNTKGPWGIGPAGVGTEGRTAYSAMHNAVDVILRARTGAQANPSEIDEMIGIFSPTVLDTTESAKWKLDRLEQMLAEAQSATKGGGMVTPRPAKDVIAETRQILGRPPAGTSPLAVPGAQTGRPVAVNPKTGQKVEWDGQQWLPVK